MTSKRFQKKKPDFPETEWVIVSVYFWNNEVKDWMFGQMSLQDLVVRYNIISLYLLSFSSIFNEYLRRLSFQIPNFVPLVTQRCCFLFYFLFFTFCSGASSVAEENRRSLFEFPACLSSRWSAALWECGLVWVISKLSQEDTFFLSILLLQSHKCDKTSNFLLVLHRQRIGLTHPFICCLWGHLTWCVALIQVLISLFLNSRKVLPKCWLFCPLRLSAGTWAPWAPRSCAITSLVWSTSSASCAANTQKWCRPLGLGWKTGYRSASTSSATTAGTATPRPGTTTCSDACCYAVSKGTRVVLNNLKSNLQDNKYPTCWSVPKHIRTSSLILRKEVQKLINNQL